jgi:signal transduction histidine kinase
MAAKTMAEVVWRLSVEEGNAGLVAVAAKAMAEGGRVAGRWRRPQQQSSRSAVVVVRSYR